MLVHRCNREELERIEVAKSPLSVLIGKQISESQEHVAVHHGQELLGVKPTDPAKGEASIISHRLVLFVLDEISRGMRLGNSEINYTARPSTWAACFRGNLGSERIRDLRSAELEIFSDAPPRYFSSLFVPSIAAVNGFDYNDIQKFYLLAVPKSGIGQGILTLAKFQLNLAELEKLETEDKKRKYLSQVAMGSIVPNFTDKFIEFTDTEEDLSNIRLRSDELTAIMLDFLDLNLKPQSLESDTALKRRVNNELWNAQQYFSTKDNCQALLTYLAADRRLNFSSSAHKRKDVEAILKERDAYKKIVKRLLTGKNRDEEERSKYVEAQYQAMMNI
jgi:hypothetical protein